MYQAFRTLIPRPQDRTPVTWNALPYAVASCIPFVFMAYLSRRPDTYLIRLLLLPTVITAILGTAYRFVWTVPQLNVYNWGQCIVAEVVIGKALEFAFTKEGMLKVGESRPGEVKGINQEGANGHASKPGQPSHPFIAPWLYDALEVTHTMRGLKWKFGQGTHIPKETKPLDRIPFLRATFFSFLKNFIFLDFLESSLKFFPGVGTTLGGSMFYSNLSPVPRYAVSTLIHMITGSALLHGFGMCYDLVTLVAVGLLDGSPTCWPPVVDDPWSSDSMHVFWSKRWHQLLRQTFMVFGGYPGKLIAGNLGMLFGAFIASGLFHECSMYAMGRGFDHTVTIFFALQGPLLIFERLWRKITGRRISGWMGRLWVYFILFIAAQPLVNAWHRRGLGGGLVIPPFMSPVRWILVPILQRILHQRL